MTGSIGMIVLAWPLFWLASSGDFLLVVLTFVIGCSVLQSLTYGPMAAFLAEQFGTRARYTGASLGYQIGSLLGAGFTPVIAASLYAGSSAIGSVVGYLIAGCALSAIVLGFFVRESKDVDITR
jgi:hypothetical protein